MFSDRLHEIMEFFGRSLKNPPAAHVKLNAAAFRQKTCGKKSQCLQALRFFFFIQVLSLIESNDIKRLAQESKT